jgi:hypothetical protein
VLIAELLLFSFVLVQSDCDSNAAYFFWLFKGQLTKCSTGGFYIGDTAEVSELDSFGIYI